MNRTVQIEARRNGPAGTGSPAHGGNRCGAGTAGGGFATGIDAPGRNMMVGVAWRR
jgi:hypothetical protein